MQRVYLDNAATTPLDPQVLEVMLPLMTDHFGNPSSIHSHGRTVKSTIEKARKSVAQLLNTSPAEIFFTSGGTEADNTALICSVESHGIQHVLSSALEHHAVLHTLDYLAQKGKITLTLAPHDAQGIIDLDFVAEWLQTHPKAMVSLMHGNNEIGNLLPLEQVGQLCRASGALFHSDTVQTMGHYVHDLQHLPIDFVVGAAHKFHGPKGVGFLYVNANTKIHPFIHGGAQERNMRGGTENVYGIVGLAKALELAYQGMSEHRAHVENLKRSFIQQLQHAIPDVRFNGLSGELDKSLYTVLNVSFPPSDEQDMLLFNLDIAKISCSGGSACSSGTNVGSHVLQALQVDPTRGNVRFSFSKFTKQEEIDYAVKTLVDLFKPETV